MGTGRESNSLSISRKRNRRVTRGTFKVSSGWKFLIISTLLMILSVLGLLAPGNTDGIVRVVEIILKSF